MRLVGVAGSPVTAPCSRLVTPGSLTVFADGMGVARVGVDTAHLVPIVGPGSPTVFVEGAVVSLVGDAITVHDSKPTHTVFTTTLAVRTHSVWSGG